MTLRLRATGRDRLGVDADEVRRALAVLADPAAGVELRALPSGRSRVLPSTALDDLVKTADGFSDDDGVYYTLNPIPPDLNHAARVGDVLRRRWLLIDVDPAKPTYAKDDSSSEEEHRAAQKLSADVRAWLMGEHEWPEPVIVNSGNGWHLLYRIDLPNDDASQQLLRRILYALAEKFDGDRGTVDRSVHNASRIAKLPGTWARKGGNAHDRPHRLARLVLVPDPVKVLTAAALERFGGRGEEKPVLPFKPAGYTTEEPSSPFVLKATLTDADAAYVSAAVKAECELVRNGKHKNSDGRNNALNAAAFSLGQLVAGGVLDRAEAEGELTAAAVDAGLEADANCGPRGIAATIKSGIESGMKKPRGVPVETAETAEAPKREKKQTASDATKEIWAVEFNGEVAVEGPAAEFPVRYGRQSSTARRRVFEIRTLGELMRTEFPDPNWAIPGLLAEGLNLLAGSPKSGKSMLALNLALTVAGGGHALGNIKTIPGDVLYLSLEDQDRRVQWRAKKMAALIGRGTEQRLSVVTKWPRMDQGGIGLLDEWIKRVESPRLVVIDVLGKFRPMLKERGNQYEQDSQHMYQIKEFADERKLTGLVIHHTRKTVGKDKGDDEMEDVSGTQGLAGGCDGILVLKRARRSNDATVSITGRDDAEQKLALHFDPVTLTWASMGSAEEHLTGKLQSAVLAYMKQLIGRPLFPSEIAAHLVAEKIADTNTDSVRVILGRLLERGFIRRQTNAWVYPGMTETVAAVADAESF